MPDPAFPQMQAELPYCGVCVLIDLHQERFDPAHDPAPWTTALPQPCQPPDLMPWEALALLDRARWHLTLADLAPWVRDDHHWWFQLSDPSEPQT